MTTPKVPGFDREMFTHQGRSHPVYRAGAGPAVIVIHEIPGIHPGMIIFAQRLLEAGYRVYLPSLFGRPGEPFGAGPLLRSMLRVCVSREFAILADRTSPVATWLRALAAAAHRECGGPGVGAIGMCVTGGFALAMAVEPAVLAPVVSQPGLPAPITTAKRAAVGLDATDLAQVKERTHRGLCVLGLRFSADRGCPAERFATLRRELGGAFEAIEVDSSPGNPHGIPTRAALDRVLGFLDQRLHP
jgi:dienelactone hydrolase